MASSSLKRFSFKWALLTALGLLLGCSSELGLSAEPPLSNEPVNHVVINIPSRTLWVYQGTRVVRYFPVGVGRNGFMTPVGKFSIISKVIDPGWENPYKGKGKFRLAPGDDNPLGTRWMGFYRKGSGEYGMHGTDNPLSVGRFSSHGCVRMKVKDAEALFDMVEIGTPVEVTYEPVLIRKQDDKLRVIVYRDRFHRGMPSAEQVSRKILKQYPQAQLEPEKLKAALYRPSEHPVEVGSIPEEPVENTAELPFLEKQ